jgi:glycosyltransferase involved in cell wall biosynthesis
MSYGTSSAAAFLDYYRCPPALTLLAVHPQLSSETGYFKFGDSIGFGRVAGLSPAPYPTDSLVDVIDSLGDSSARPVLPFDLTEVVTNLREERYRRNGYSWLERTATASSVQRLYYGVRPLLPIGVRKHVQKAALSGWRRITFPRWPVDATVDTLMQSVMAVLLRRAANTSIPFVWFWPEGATACAMVTHDVEGQAGLDFCDRLMDLDDSFGIKSAFQLIPEGPHQAWRTTADRLRARGFEVNLHDLNHDGLLFARRGEFLDRAKRINRYARELQCEGFRAGAMYREQSWFDAFEFAYDMSVPNAAHLEPQRGGCCTVMPYFVGDILELPLTMTQDYTLFHILNDYSVRLWKEQSALIVNRHGLVSVIAHPDYLVGSREREVYTDLLRHLVALRESDGLWMALPAEINRWWRDRRQMTLVPDGTGWRIEGPGSERARVAYASLSEGRVAYSWSPLQAQGRKVRAPGLPYHYSAMNTRDADRSVLISPVSRTVSRAPRVCHIAYTFYERDNRVRRYAEALAGRGSAVDVIALRRDGQPPRAELNGVQVLRLQRRQVTEGAAATYLAKLVLFLFRSMALVSARHFRQPYDVVHVHNVPDFLVFAPWIPKLSGARVVLDIHDILPELYGDKFAQSQHSWTFRTLQWVERRSARFADHVIVAGELWRERLIARAGLTPERCTALLNYPDRTLFKPLPPDQRRADGRFIVLYPGTLNHHQGVDIALDAFAKVLHRMPRAEFHIYGEGPAAPLIANRIEAGNLQQSVLLHRPLPIDAIARVMADADLGVIPKRADGFGNEAFSTKSLEFMACGVPIVMSRTQVDGAYFDSSLVRFFDPGSVDDLARALLLDYEHPDDRRARAQRGSCFVARTDWASKLPTYLDIVSPSRQPFAETTT